MATSRALPLAQGGPTSRLAASSRHALAGGRVPAGDTANAVGADMTVGSSSKTGAKVAGGLLVATVAGLWGWGALRAPDSGTGMWTMRGKAE